MKEEWRVIKGFPNYKISNAGKVVNIVTGKTKNARVKNNGYLILDLYEKGKVKTVYLHRLVAIAFIDNPFNKSTVNHLDGNKLNNCVSNLEWATPSEQNTHFYREGLKSKENINKSIKAMNKANAKKVKCIELDKCFNSIADASRYLGKNTCSLISLCCTGARKKAYGYTWKFV